MTIQNSSTLKGYFNTGDIPTESQFSDLIDSTDNAAIPASSMSLTNKTLNDSTNYIDADALHEKVFLNLGGASTIGMPVQAESWNGANSAIQITKCQKADSVKCLGLMETVGADGTVGSVRTSGVLTGVDTSTWSEGALLYVNTSGTLTTTKPTGATEYIKIVGTVVRQHATLGVIDVHTDTPTRVIDTNPMTTAGDIIYGGTSGTPTRLAKGNDSEVLTLASGVPTWAAASGGGIIDYASGSVAISTTSTATISRSHNCTGTTADYSLMLPALNANKGIEICIDAACTKLIHVSVGSDAVAKSNTLTGGTAVNAAGSGTLSATASTTVTCSVSVAAILRPGDLVMPLTATGAAGALTQHRVVTVGTTTFTIAVAATIPAGSSWVYTQTGIASSGSALNSDYTVGDGCTIGSLTRQVTWINAGGTAMAVDLPYLTAPSSSAHGKTITKIDGKYYRIMWANEVAGLVSTATDWQKRWGKTMAMSGKMNKSSALTTTVGVMTKSLFDTSEVNLPAGIVNTTNSRFDIKRESVYNVASWKLFYGTNSSATVLRDLYAKNGSQMNDPYKYAVASNNYYSACAEVYSLLPGDFIESYISFATGSYTSNQVVYGGSWYNAITINEVPQW